MKNSFNELCELASKKKWCWTLYCSTCAHMNFRYAFQEIANSDPIFDSQWQPSKDTKFPRSFSKREKLRILETCLEANLEEISLKCSFPDWLGYLGLVIHHSKSDLPEYKALSIKWCRQLIDLGSKNRILLNDFHSILNGQTILNIEHLGSFETYLYEKFRH